MRVVRLTLLSLALVFCAASFTEVSAQDGAVTGQVTDASTGEPLVGVQISVAGMNLGGLTNAEGRFLINNVPAGEQRIRAARIGYGQETILVTVPPGGTVTADFALGTSAVPLEAVIVSAATGREQRARELGTAVATIDVENLNPAPITSIADALGGRAAGVVMQDVNGTTGTSQRIRIRGANSLSLSNEPLVYVDGMRINNDFGGFGVGGQEPNRLNDINPNDIANVEIVKGPAASAMYGTAAANGVILITTKRGRPGTTQWTAFVEQGAIDDATDYPGNFAALDIIDENEPLFLEEGTFEGFVNPNAAQFCPNRLAAAGSCAQDVEIGFNTLEDSRTSPFDTGNRARYGVSVRGGTEQVRYFVSGQFEDETGIIGFNTQEKVNFRANLDAALSETADVAVSVGYTDANLSLNNNDNSIFSPIINGLLGYPNFIPPDTSRGRAGAPVNNLGLGFRFSQEQLAVLPVEQTVDRYVTSVNLRWRPLSWLTVNTQGGLDLTSLHDFETLQPDELPIARTFALGFRQSQRSRGSLYTGQVSGVSTFALSDDLISSTTVGGQYTQDKSENTFCFGSTLAQTTASCGTTASDFSIDEDFFEVRTIGGYIQEQLAWRDRLFLDAGLRADETSTFGSDFDLVYYPSAAVSWVVAEEDFFPQLDFLNTLRLRAAYGESGLQPGFRQASTVFEPAVIATPSGDRVGASLDNTGNIDLRPEQSREFEFGFDAGFLDNRVSLAFTYFDKTSEDALISRPLPGSLGVTGSVLQNLGSVANKGTELTLNLQVFDIEDVGLNVGFTNSTLDNEIQELGKGIEPIIFNRGLQRHEEGFTAGAFFQVPYTFDDADGNGLLSISEVDFVRDEEGNVVDAEFIGPALPEWQRTIFADLRLFDFLTVSSLFEGRGGHFTGNDSEAFRCGAISSYGCPAVGDPDASLDEQARYIADRFLGTAHGYVEEADFYRWRELSVTLSAPRTWAQRFQQLDGLRLTLAGRNLALWTDYTGLDPETVEGGGNANFSQSEFNTQPPVRYLMARLDYNF